MRRLDVRIGRWPRAGATRTQACRPTPPRSADDAPLTRTTTPFAWPAAPLPAAHVIALLARIPVAAASLVAGHRAVLTDRREIRRSLMCRAEQRPHGRQRTRAVERAEPQRRCRKHQGKNADHDSHPWLGSSPHDDGLTVAEFSREGSQGREVPCRAMPRVQPAFSDPAK